MSVASTIARILLGVTFTLVSFVPLFAGNPPPMPGLVGVINSAFYQSHWIFAISFAQFVVGVLLLTNRYVPVALIILAAFMYNSLVFHSLVAPALLPLPLVVVVLWFIVCLPYRAHFAALFNAKPRDAASAAPRFQRTTS